MGSNPIGPVYRGDNMDKHKRSIAKAVSWRILATLITMILVFIFTGEMFLSLGIGFFELLSKIVLYYIHERVWFRITWGH